MLEAEADAGVSEGQEHDDQGGQRPERRRKRRIDDAGEDVDGQRQADQRAGEGQQRARVGQERPRARRARRPRPSPPVRTARVALTVTSVIESAPRAPGGEPFGPGEPLG
jgi:hypothetical protein